MSAEKSSQTDPDRSGWLLGFGHPLMDLTMRVDEAFLAKYNLKANDAILADERFDELMTEVESGERKVQLSAGGSTQNVIRVAQASIKNDECVTCFIGSVGSDEYGEQMKCLMQSDSVNCEYQIKLNYSTGICLVLLSRDGLDRSLITNLQAADTYEWNESINQHITRAKIIYSSGFTLGKLSNVNFKLAQACINDSKVFCLNLSSDYVSKSYADKIMQLLPSIGILFGNSSEVKSLATALNWTETSLNEIIDKLTRVPNSIVGYRVLVITCNCEPIYLATSSQLQSSTYVKQIPVPQVSPIIDTNCAGDAFVGGFLAHLIENHHQHDQLISHHTLDINRQDNLLTQATHAAIRSAQAVMQCIGCDTSVIKRLHEKQC